MFNQYPYINENDLNLDYILKKVAEVLKAFETFKHIETIKIANPILWNIQTPYEKNTVVLDSDGNAYLSLRAENGQALSDSDYWQEIFNFALYVRTANENLTLHIEQNVERSTHAYNVDDWLLWNDVLYKVIAAVSVDDLLEIDVNVERFTVEQFCRAWVTYGTNLINQYKYDIDASELAYKNQIDGIVTTYYNNTQALIDQIISGATVDSEVINARVAYDDKEYTTLKLAINTKIKAVSENVCNDFIDRMTLKHTRLDGQGINGASYSAGAVTIPAGSTGQNSYCSSSFEKAKTLDNFNANNKICTAFTIVDIVGLDYKEFEVITYDPSLGTQYTNTSTLIYKDGNRYYIAATFTFPAANPNRLGVGIYWIIPLNNLENDN